ARSASTLPAAGWIADEYAATTAVLVASIPIPCTTASSRALPLVASSWTRLRADEASRSRQRRTVRSGTCGADGDAVAPTVVASTTLQPCHRCLARKRGKIRHVPPQLAQR